MRLHILLPLCLALHLPASDWPQFRGPRGDGHAAARSLPVSFNETNRTGLKWKTAIHGRGWSSPVILGEQIWLTTASTDAKKLSALCVEAGTGKILHDLMLFEVERPQFIHQFNSAASPSPILEEGRAYVTFGAPGTACLEARTGKVLWERRDLECNHFRGAGSSPILHGDLLIMNFDGSDHQFIIALDKRTGKTVWRTNRSIDHKDLGPDGKPQAEGDFRKAFATPHIFTVDGQPLLVSQGAKAAYGYNPQTGAELWRVEERSSHSGGTRPVMAHGMIFFPSGWSQGQLLAVKPGGQGDVTATHVAWKVTKAVAKKPSLLLDGDLIYMMNDGGVCSAIEAKTGQEVWSERIGGNYSASPIIADGKIYLCSEEGKISVIATGREFRKISESKLSDGFMASPAVTDQALILRTKSHLYRFE